MDPNTLPLPAQTLVTVVTLPPICQSADPTVNDFASLPLANSLAAIKSSALSFFKAFEGIMATTGSGSEIQEPSTFLSAPPIVELSPKKRTKYPPPDLWTTLLQFRTRTAYILLPLGAVRGATLSGKGEARIARQVGVFFGCEEMRESFRRGAVARVQELMDVVSADEYADNHEGGRKMVVRLVLSGREDEVVCWDHDAGSDTRGIEAMEAVLRKRSRCAFAEELFYIVGNTRASGVKNDADL